MYGHQQSNTRKLVKHWQSGGGSGKVVRIKGITFDVLENLAVYNLRLNTYFGDNFIQGYGNIASGARQYSDNTINYTYLRNILPSDYKTSADNFTFSGSTKSLYKENGYLTIGATLKTLLNGTHIYWSPKYDADRSQGTYLVGLDPYAQNQRVNADYPGNGEPYIKDVWTTNSSFRDAVLVDDSSTTGLASSPSCYYNAPTTIGLKATSTRTTASSLSSTSKGTYSGVVYIPLQLNKTVYVTFIYTSQNLSDVMKEAIEAGAAELYIRFLQNSIFGFYDYTNRTTHTENNTVNSDVSAIVDFEITNT